MIAHKKEFYGGVVMMVAFCVVLVIIFMPIFGGQTALIIWTTCTTPYPMAPRTMFQRSEKPPRSCPAMR